MKTYTEHIFEELVQDNSTEAKLRRYLERRRKEYEERENKKLHPENREELQDMIIAAIEKDGPEADLNHIDVSGVDNMNSLFSSYHGGDKYKRELLRSFNGDISEWDVSRVKNMRVMFCVTTFNGDISDWDVSNVKDMSGMFCGAKKFNQDISRWEVGSVTNMNGMFYCAPNFNQDISKWEVGSVSNMEDMFNGATSFNQNISDWVVDGVDKFDNIFKNCPIKEEFKPKRFQERVF